MRQLADGGVGVVDINLNTNTKVKHKLKIAKSQIPKTQCHPERTCLPAGRVEGLQSYKANHNIKINQNYNANTLNKKEIITKLPYSKPFLFVDELIDINETGLEGTFMFDENLDFFKGHFKDNPVTPGVILTECCAQIGVVCLGIYLLGEQNDIDSEDLQIGLSSSEMEFLVPVFPNEKVTVTSEKIYFRFHKLKCRVKMHNATGKLVCKGTISGMLKFGKNG